MVCPCLYSLFRRRLVRHGGRIPNISVRRYRGFRTIERLPKNLVVRINKDEVFKALTLEPLPEPEEPEPPLEPEEALAFTV